MIPVSVAIVNYNQAAYLDDAIISALRQTHRPLEIVVYDDGSTDDSLKVAEKYRNYGLTVVAAKHRGACAAFNAAVQSTHTEFYSILAGDDVLEDAYIARCLAALEEHPRAAYAYTDILHITDRGSSIEKMPTWPVDDGNPSEIDYQLLCSSFIHGSAMVRRSAFDLIGGFDETMNEMQCEDWNFWLSLLERNWRGVLISEPLFGYRHHVGSRSTRRTTDSRWFTDHIMRVHPTLYTPEIKARVLHEIWGER